MLLGNSKTVVLNNQLINLCTVFFNRIGTWFLTGPSLWNFCCNRNITVDNEIHIGLYGVSVSDVLTRCELFNIKVEDINPTTITATALESTIIIHLYEDSRKGTIASGAHRFPKEWLFCNANTVHEIRKKNGTMGGDGLWHVPLSQIQAIEFKLPYMAGSVCDSYKSDWFVDLKHDPVEWNIHDIFFDEARKTNGVELLGQLYECGRKAGIDHAMFIGFGTALGAIRHGDFIPNDRDMDMCIIADWITTDQGLAYVSECEKAHLDEYRWRTPECRGDTGMPLWFSLGPKNPVSQSGVKCCQWFWFKHDGYWWHSKNKLWIDPKKFNPHKTTYTNKDDAIAKGIPEFCLNKLVGIKFKGIDVKIPDGIGSCLDSWYPSWMSPAEGASAHEHILVVGDWTDKNTWRTS